MSKSDWFTISKREKETERYNTPSMPAPGSNINGNLDLIKSMEGQYDEVVFRGNFLQWVRDNS